MALGLPYRLPIDILTLRGAGTVNVGAICAGISGAGSPALALAAAGVLTLTGVGATCAGAFGTGSQALAAASTGAGVMASWTS